MNVDRILGYNIPGNFLNLYLGYLPSEDVAAADRYLVRILLIAAKKAITRKWLQEEPPTLKNWLEITEEIYVMERLTYLLRLRMGIFQKKWAKWIVYNGGRDTTKN